MLLYKLGIPAVAPMSETCFITDVQYQKFKERYKHLILFYDNDRPGLAGMIRIRKQYPDIIPI